MKLVVAVIRPDRGRAVDELRRCVLIGEEITLRPSASLAVVVPALHREPPAKRLVDDRREQPVVVAARDVEREPHAAASRPSAAAAMRRAPAPSTSRWPAAVMARRRAESVRSSPTAPASPPPEAGVPGGP